MKKIYILILFGIASVVNGAIAQSRDKLKHGTPVSLELNDVLNIKNCYYNKIVRLRITAPVVTENGHIAITKGTQAEGVVIEIRRQPDPDFKDPRVYIVIKALRVRSQTGQYIALDGTPCRIYLSDDKGILQELEHEISLEAVIQNTTFYTPPLN